MASEPEAANKRVETDTCDNQIKEVAESMKTEDLSDKQLQSPTGINRQVYNFLKNLLEAKRVDTNHDDVDGTSSIDNKLYIALQFLNSGEYHSQVSEDVSHSSANHHINNLINCLVEVAPQFIKFPIQEAANTQFYDLGEHEYGTGFPNVMGAIDCMHVQLQAPTNDPELYVNRHLHHSINVQIVCGPDLVIYNVLSAFPGGTEDSCIWHNSNLRRVLAESAMDKHWLIGDSEYPQEPWLMTPLIDPKSPAEELYNKLHAVTWNRVKECIEVLKSRFRCLQSILNFVPEKVCAIVTACCVLHNICVKFGDVVEIDPDLKEPHEEHIEQIIVDSMEEGVIARDGLIKTNFSC